MIFGDYWTGCNDNTNLYCNDELANEITINKDIPSYAFYGIGSITKVILGEGVTRIGDHAFFDCSGLTEIYYQGTMDQWLNMVFGDYWISSSNNNTNLYINNELVDEITINADIPSCAFYSIDSITKVTLGEGVTSIGDDAFSYCTNLTEITLPSSLTSIGSNAFSGCSALQSIEIPASVTSIGSNAFSGCSALQSIEIPASVTSIGSNAFRDCSNLTEIILPASLTSIDYSAFDGCYALALVINNSVSLTITKGGTDNGYVGYYAKEVVNNGATAQGRIEIIDNVQYYINDTTNEFIALAPAISRNAINSISLADGTKEINQYAFNNCSNLTEITLPSSLISIGSWAFQNCTSLATVTFAEGSQLESIGRLAFYDCSALQSIEIPESVTSIGERAFYNCRSLETVTFAEGSQLESIGDDAFSYCSELTEITLPSSLTSIGNSAFNACSNITEITLPASLISIGIWAFSSCSNLATVTIESDDIYIDATGTDYNHAGYLLANATTVRVLTTIVDTCDNSYLENTSNFETSLDGEYTVFTKVS